MPVRYITDEQRRQADPRQVKACRLFYPGSIRREKTEKNPS